MKNIIEKENIEKLLSDIASDYRKYQSKFRDGCDDIDEEMAVEFESKLSYKINRKYIHIISDGGSWGFINLANPDFAVGDILFSASWAKPSLNHARGNIFTGYDIEWTGPKYLR